MLQGVSEVSLLTSMIHARGMLAPPAKEEETTGVVTKIVAEAREETARSARALKSIVGVRGGVARCGEWSKRV